jgi:hypothetical protein
MTTDEDLLVQTELNTTPTTVISILTLDSYQSNSQYTYNDYYEEDYYYNDQYPTASTSKYSKQQNYGNRRKSERIPNKVKRKFRGYIAKKKILNIFKPINFQQTKFLYEPAFINNFPSEIFS